MTTLPEATIHRLARLPAPARDALLTAIATTQRASKEWALEREHWRLALEPLGFVPASGQLVQREIPLASTLGGEQRLVAEALAFVPGLPLERWPLYRASWLARRWLGLEPGGVLFAEVEVELDGVRHRWPLLHALRTLVRRGPAQAEAFLATLPWSTKVAVLALVHGAPEDVYASALTAATEKTIRQCVAPPGPVDVLLLSAVAEEILARATAPFVPGEQTRGGPNEKVAMLLLGALVAGGVPLEPRHDALLRLGFGIFEPVTRRAIAAIAPERRDAALVAALGRMLHDVDRARVGTLYLDEHPLPGFVDAVIAAAGRTDAPKKALAALAPAAAAHPIVASRLAQERARLEGLPTWRVAERVDPIVADALGPLHRRQLEILEARYAGRHASSDVILARTGKGDDDEGILPAHTARLTIVDDRGVPRFDAWLAMGDAGVVFETGTERVVAEIIQGGVESADRTLRLSLPDVLSFTAPKKKASPTTKAKARTTSSEATPAATKKKASPAATKKKASPAATRKKVSPAPAKEKAASPSTKKPRAR
ncbi:MAG: hypothetical protein OHK0013_08170 [Sandaracinaceae bacterium]